MIPLILGLQLAASPVHPASPDAGPAPTNATVVAGSALPRTGQVTLSWRVPTYPGAEGAPVPVGDTLEAHGMPMNVQAFTTKDSAQQVLAYYRQVFEAWSLPMLGNGDLIKRMPYPSITVIDPDQEVEISVIAIPSQDGVTTVLLALADIKTFEGRVGQALAARYGGLPEYPDGENPSAVTSTDGERRSVMVSFRSADPIEKVVGFYREALTKQGFKAVEQPDSTPSSRSIDFVGAERTWHFMASRDTASGRTVVTATGNAEAVPWNR